MKIIIILITQDTRMCKMDITKKNINNLITNKISQISKDITSINILKINKITKIYKDLTLI